MAWARPSSPVSTARSGRTMSIGRNVPVVAAQPRQQPGPQKRRLARPRTGRGSPAATPPPRCACRAARPGRARSGRRARRTPPHRLPPAVPTPDTGRAPGRPAGATGSSSAPIPNARRPFSSRCRPSVANTTGSPAIDADRGGGAVADEQVAALPLRGDVGVGHRLQPGAPRSPCSTSRHTGTRSGIPGRLPNAPTAGRSPPHSGLLACCSACFHRCPGPNPGVRVQIQDRSPRPAPAPARPATP